MNSDSMAFEIGQDGEAGNHHVIKNCVTRSTSMPARDVLCGDGAANIDLKKFRGNDF